MKAYETLKTLLAMVIIALILAVKITTINANASDGLDIYRQIAQEIEAENGYTNVIDTSKINSDIIKNRGQRILIERVIGTVVDDQGNGRVLNINYNTDPQGYYNYISYAGQYENIQPQKGDVMITYIIYNPGTTGEDDYIGRIDYVADRPTK